MARDQLATEDNQILDERRAARLPHFKKVRGTLWRVAAPEKGGGTPQRQLLVPKLYRKNVLEHAHGHTWVGHQGRIRTLARILDKFYWPAVTQDVQNFCKRCTQCQITSKRGPPKAPLQPMPLIEQPFERIAMDFIGPLPRMARGHKFLLVIVDNATR